MREQRLAPEAMRDIGTRDRAGRWSLGPTAIGAGAYLIWGLFPAFFGLLSFTNPVEILAERVLWTLVVSLVLLLCTGRIRELRGIRARTWWLAAAASLALTVNWGVYVYGVTSHHVVECALGYFINPLVTVVLGLLIFRERLTLAQWAALAFGAVAVVVLTVDYGRPPVIALVLACSFGLYGLVKKIVPLDAVRGVAAEGLVAAPPALAVVIGIAVTGHATFGHGAGHTALLISTGPVTLVPLLLFALAAQRVPLTTLGILQYLTPALQMAWGVLVGHEPMPPSRWVGFGLIWLALLVFTGDAVHRTRRRAALRA